MKEDAFWDGRPCVATYCDVQIIVSESKGIMYHDLELERIPAIRIDQDGSTFYLEADSGAWFWLEHERPEEVIANRSWLARMFDPIEPPRRLLKVYKEIALYERYA